MGHTLKPHFCDHIIIVMVGMGKTVSYANLYEIIGEIDIMLNDAEFYFEN